MNNTTYNTSSAAESTVNLPVAIVKFLVGFITLFFYGLILISLPSCTSMKKTSRLLLVTLCALYFNYFVLLTFYSPLIGGRFVPVVENKGAIKFISIIWLFPIYALHYHESVMAADRLIAVGFPDKYQKYFSVKRTYTLIISVILYGLAYSLPSVADCCLTIFDVKIQIWIYPNDGVTHYRQYFGLISNYGNGVASFLMYSYVLYCLQRLK